MKISPLQPETIVFDDVFVQVQFDENNTCMVAPDFNFQGVNFNCDVGHGDIESEGNDDDLKSMLVSIRLQIENNSGKFAPYKLNVKVSGIFKWLDTKTDPTKRKDLMVVNGASILYGAVREMVLTITSRSVAGPLTLPSFNFEDNKPSENPPLDASNGGDDSVKQHRVRPRRKA